MRTCRICGGLLHTFCDFGAQPLSSAFLEPDRTDGEFFFRLAVGLCESCTMVQLVEEVPRHLMFRQEYPYLSSGSATMRKHFEQTAQWFLETELTGPDPFIVELGCNDGVMLKTIAQAGVRHLGVEPSRGVAEVARNNGVRVSTDFFQEDLAVRTRQADGVADVVYAANTVCHIPYLDSIFRGLDALLAPGGVFVFEDPYLAEIVERTAYDQIYDEHFYYFTATSVRNMARFYGFELVNVERLPVHGGEVRYTIARVGRRQPSPSVAELLVEEERRGLSDLKTLRHFVSKVERAGNDLVCLLERLRAEGRSVVGYGATAKSATVTNYCAIGPDLLPFVCDTTPAKQGRLTPGAHIPVFSPERFSQPYPDYALLFAWNHAEEIVAKEQEFRKAGGRWILYVPSVHIV
ncbi:methyltransferase domain-containing protein [Streptomyces sp. NPDC020801]|uniref:methyltransferase domain-containing protein n=1 Tax=unclassified Streptomyces TaxID=2593676 RepID=UPI0037B91747